MKVLVTGSTGFLGRRVVAEFLRRGHVVNVLVRPGSRLDNLPWLSEVEVYQADLRTSGDLAAAFDGVEMLVHLAAAVTGNEDTHFDSAVVGTEHLLEVMAGTSTRRLTLASSFSVYAWSDVRGTLDESSPLEQAPHLYSRDSYTIAKVWQERVARQYAMKYQWDLTVLRPGFIWGQGNEYFAALGHQIGRVHLVIGPRARLPITHVDNCADLFVTAAENPKAAGETFNVVDDDSARAWNHLGEHIRYSRMGGVRVPVPYRVALSITGIVDLLNQWAFQGAAKLPGILVPRRFQARFKPLRFCNKKVREVLGWAPPYDRKECLRRTYKQPAA